MPKLVGVKEVGDRRVYLLNWNASEGEFFEGFIAAETIIRSAYGYDTEIWEFEILFPNQEELITFLNHCRENDIPDTLGQMQTLTEPNDYLLDSVLTEKQRDALVLALQQGYFQNAIGLESMGYFRYAAWYLAESGSATAVVLVLFGGLHYSASFDLRLITLVVLAVVNVLLLFRRIDLLMDELLERRSYRLSR